MLEFKENRFKTKSGPYSQYLLYDGKTKVVDFRVPRPDTKVDELKTLYLKCQNSTGRTLQYIKDKINGKDIEKKYRGRSSDKFNIEIHTPDDNRAIIVLTDSQYPLCYIKTKNSIKSKKFAENLLALLNGNDEVYEWTECY